MVKVRTIFTYTAVNVAHPFTRKGLPKSNVL